MPRFSINVSMMLTEVAFLDRFAAAADLGFGGVDIQFPYEHPAASVGTRARAAGVAVVLINVPAGDLQSGGNGLACVPGREAAFRDAVQQARAYCRELECKRVNVLAGRPPAELTRGECLRTFTGNLAYAAETLQPDGITVMVETINGRDVPGFLLQTTEDTVAALDAAGAGNLGVQFDLYHRQIMEGDLIPGLERYLPRIAHIQFADTPGRHEPGTGEINFPNVFAAIDRLGYQGWVGAEYRPLTNTADSLGWFQPWRRA